MAVYYATNEGAEALAASATETALQLIGTTTTRAKVLGFGIGFDSVDATDIPVTVRLLRQTTDGTSSAASEVERDPAGVAAAVTAFHSFSAEPTPGDVIMPCPVPANGGMFIHWFPPRTEPVIDAATTSRIALDCTTGTGTTPNVHAWFCWEEGGDV